MKLFFTVLLATISTLFSQTITFEKTLKNLDTPIYSVVESGDYFYINSNRICSKLDKYGNVEWTIKIPQQDFSSGKSFRLMATANDGGVIIPGFTENKELLVHKISADGDVNNTIITSSGGEEIGLAAITLENGGYYVVSLVDNDYLNLYKLSENFTIEQTDTISYSFFGFAVKIGIIQIGANELLIFGPAGLVKILNGKESWRVTGLFSNAIVSNNNIYALRNNILDKYDLQGNLVSSVNLPIPMKGFNIFSDNTIVAASNSKIYRLQSDGTEIWQSPFRGSGIFFDIKETADNGILVAGGYQNSFGLLLKASSDGNFKSIDIMSPNYNDRWDVFSTTKITWYTNITSFFKIELSADGGNNWEIITEFVTSDVGEYTLNVPEISSTDCLIRITDTNDPLNFDISDDKFRISYAKDYDYVAANQVLMWVNNNGIGSNNPITGQAGFYWPGGIDATQTAVFQDGLVWGGIVDGEVRVNGSTYRTGLKPGYILENGLPSDPESETGKIYKIKKNWGLLEIE